MEPWKPTIYYLDFKARMWNMHVATEILHYFDLKLQWLHRYEM